VCYQIEVSATSWSLVERSPTECGATICVILKSQEWWSHEQCWVAAPQKKISNFILSRSLLIRFDTLFIVNIYSRIHCVIYTERNSWKSARYPLCNYLWRTCYGAEQWLGLPCTFDSRDHVFSVTALVSACSLCLWWFFVALCVSMQSTCDVLICSQRIPTSDLLSKTHKQNVSDPGEHFLKKNGNRSRKLLLVNVCRKYLFGLPCLVIMC
jgi:hypothetical protein